MSIEETASLAKVDPWVVMLRNHLAFDVKMNVENKYTPSAGVLRSREFHRQADEIQKLGQAVRPDFWMEWSGKETLHVGFRDNKDKALYQAAMQKLEDLMYAAGYGLKSSGMAYTAVLNKALADKMEGRHGEWLKAMAKAGAPNIK